MARHRQAAPAGLRLPPAVRVEALEARALLSFGDLDPTFGTGGKVTTDFPASANEEAKAIVVQPDGKYVVAGAVASQIYGRDSAFGLARYHPDGTLDATFGDGGKVLVAFGRNAAASSVALAPGGKIVAAGITSTSIAYEDVRTDFAVVRLNPDGTPDTTFDGDGRLVVRIDGRNAWYPGVAVQADGKTVLAGSAGKPAPDPISSTAVVRLNLDGSFDASFGVDGKAVGATGLTGASDVAIDSDGRVVVAGSAEGRLAVARLTPSGAADIGFDGDGMATAAFAGASSSFARAVEVMPDGRVMAAGTAWMEPASDVAVARFNADGSPDATFSGDGRITLGDPALGDQGLALAVAADGSVYVGGETDQTLSLYRLSASGDPDETFDGDGTLRGTTRWSAAAALAIGTGGSVVAAGYLRLLNTNADFFLARFTPSGAPDPTFNGTGSVVTDFVAMGNDRATAVVVQPDGKSVAAAVLAYDGTKYPHALRRYHADGTDDAAFGQGGVARVDGASALALQSDGKIVAGGSVYSAARQRNEWVVSRLNADGSPDATFGQLGKVVFNVSAAGHDSLYALAIQPDGRIVAVGSGDQQFAAARLLPTGQFDPSFGTGGKVVTQMRSPGMWGGWGTPTSVALAPGGKIVLAGPTGSDFYPTSTFGVVRYNADGKLDPTFDLDGKAEYGVAGLGGIDEPVKVAALPDGGLLVGSTVRHRGQTTFWADQDFVLLRLSASGAVDRFFGGAEDGIVYTDFAGGDDVLRDLVLLPDSVVLVGSAATGSADDPGADFGLARYSLSGFIDTAFGTGGKVTTDFAGLPDGATAAAAAPGGRLVVAGWATVPGQAGDLAIARYVVGDASFAGAKAFYNHSAFDGGDAAANAADDFAIAPDKAMLPGAGAGAPDGFRHVTSYSRGINGVMVDVMNLPAGAVGPGDFSFRSAAGGSAWRPGPRPQSITVRRGAGAGGGDRVTIVWNDYDPRSSAPDQAVANGWLELTVKATANTGLKTPLAFRLGNLIGETGDGPATDVVGAARVVDARDVAVVRAAHQRSATPANASDFDRDGRVNVIDLALARASAGGRLPAPPTDVTPVAAFPPRKPLRREAYALLA